MDSRSRTSQMWPRARTAARRTVRAIKTARRCARNLGYVNSAIASRRKARIDELLPWNWKANQADDCQSSLSLLGTAHPEITCGTDRMLTDWIALFGFDFRQ